MTFLFYDIRIHPSIQSINQSIIHQSDLLFYKLSLHFILLYQQVVYVNVTSFRGLLLCMHVACTEGA